MKTRHKLWLIGLLSMALVSCSGGGGGKDKVTLTKATDRFATGDYDQALSDFERLIATEGSQAATGAGWCLIRLSSVARADSFFATTAADSIPDAYAGWSFTSWALNDPNDAIAQAAFVLRKDADFHLGLDARVTKDNLIWIQASSYLQLANYTACYNKIKLLDGGYVYPTGTNAQIATALMQKLQSLGSAS